MEEIPVFSWFRVVIAGNMQSLHCPTERSHDLYNLFKCPMAFTSELTNQIAAITGCATPACIETLRS